MTFRNTLTSTETTSRKLRFRRAASRRTASRHRARQSGVAIAEIRKEIHLSDGLIRGGCSRIGPLRKPRDLDTCLEHEVGRGIGVENRGRRRTVETVAVDCVGTSAIDAARRKGPCVDERRRVVAVQLKCGRVIHGCIRAARALPGGFWIRNSQVGERPAANRWVTVGVGKARKIERRRRGDCVVPDITHEKIEVAHGKHWMYRFGLLIVLREKCTRGVLHAVRRLELADVVAVQIRRTHPWA